MGQIMNETKLIESHLEFTNTIAAARWKKIKSRYSLDEIKSAAYWGLVNAAKNYKNDSKASFKTYASKCINGSISRLVSDDKRYNISRGVPHTQPIVSLNNTFVDNDGTEDEFITTIVDSENIYENLLNKCDVEQLLAVANLEPKEKRVIDMYFYEQLTQSEISDKLNVTQATVSRILKVALNKIRGCLTTSK